MLFSVLLVVVVVQYIPDKRRHLSCQYLQLQTLQEFPLKKHAKTKKAMSSDNINSMFVQVYVVLTI